MRATDTRRQVSAGAAWHSAAEMRHDGVTCGACEMPPTGHCLNAAAESCHERPAQPPFDEPATKGRFSCALAARVPVRIEPAIDRISAGSNEPNGQEARHITLRGWRTGRWSSEVRSSSRFARPAE